MCPVVCLVHREGLLSRLKRKKHLSISFVRLATAELAKPNVVNSQFNCSAGKPCGASWGFCLFLSQNGLWRHCIYKILILLFTHFSVPLLEWMNSWMNVNTLGLQQSIEFHIVLHVNQTMMLFPVGIVLNGYIWFSLCYVHVLQLSWNVVPCQAAFLWPCIWVSKEDANVRY